MSAVKRISKNIFFLSSAELVSKTLQFILMVYAARLLDQAAFGKFSFALSLSFIAVIVADLGINTLLIREISREKSKVGKYFLNAFSVKILFAIVTFAFVIIFLNLLSYPKDTSYIAYIIYIFIILSTFTDLFYSVFRSFEKMVYDALLKIIRMILLTGIGLYVLIRYKNVFVFSLTFVLAELFVLGLAYLIAFKKFIKIKEGISLDFMKEIVKKSIPLGLLLYSAAFISILTALCYQ